MGTENLKLPQGFTVGLQACSYKTENIPALHVSDWSAVRIYPRVLRLIGPTLAATSNVAHASFVRRDTRSPSLRQQPGLPGLHNPYLSPFPALRAACVTLPSPSLSHGLVQELPERRRHPQYPPHHSEYDHGTVNREAQRRVLAPAQPAQVGNNNPTLSGLTDLLYASTKSLERTLKPPP
eukprot:882349-Prorocentrum_minimum.AAC.3